MRRTEIEIGCGLKEVVEKNVFGFYWVGQMIDGKMKTVWWGPGSPTSEADTTLNNTLKNIGNINNPPTNTSPSPEICYYDAPSSFSSDSSSEGPGSFTKATPLALVNQESSQYISEANKFGFTSGFITPSPVSFPLV